VIHLRDLSFGQAGARPVLNHASLDVPQGGFRWLLGPSGAGKSSFLRLLHLSLRPTQGRLEILGTDTASLGRTASARLRRRIGVVHQDYRLLSDISVFDNIALPLRLERTPEHIIRAEVTAILTWLNIAHLEKRSPKGLSGGEQQRVAIARALVKRPDLLLADEPTNALDATQAHRLINLFHDMSSLGTTIIVATHNDALVHTHPARAIHLQGNGSLLETPPKDPRA